MVLNHMPKGGRKGQTSHSMGLSVSHARVIEVRRDFAKVVARMWNEIGVVTPPTIQLKCLLQVHLIT